MDRRILAWLAVLPCFQAWGGSLAQYTLEARCRLVQAGDVSEDKMPAGDRSRTTRDGLTTCTVSLPVIPFERAFKTCSLSWMSVPPNSSRYACGVVYGAIDVEFRMQHASNGPAPDCSFVCLYNEPP